MAEFVGNEFLIREVCGPSVTVLMGEEQDSRLSLTAILDFCSSPSLFS